MSRTESHQDGQTSQAAGIASPGVQLRAAREARGETVNEVAFALRLHPRQVVALEEDDFPALPGEAFVRGFMRNYARYLGLDAAPLLARAAEMGGAQRADLSPIRNADGELPTGDVARRSVLPLGGLILVLLLMLAVGWYFDWFRTEPVEVTLEEEAALSDSVREPATSSPFARSGMPVVPAQVLPAPALPAAAAVGAAAAEEGGEALANEADAVAAEEAALDTPPTAAETVAPPADEGGTTAGENAQAVGAARLQFHFSGESWVEVRDGKGVVIHSGVNQPGTSREISGEPPFALTVGNAASVRAEFNGQALDLGANTRGSVARLTVK